MKKRIITLILAVISFGNLSSQNLTDNLLTDFFNKIKVISIELFYEDYEVIEYSEMDREFYELITDTEIGIVTKLQMNLKLKITNSEKLNKLKNSTNPIIFINFNNNKYIAKGNNVFSSSIPEECDFFFATYGDKIMFSEDEIIYLGGFKDKK